MRNLKKIFAVIMVVALMASMMVPALAAGTVNDEKAVKLNNINLMRGMDLGSFTDRIQGLVWAIRAAGKEDEALDLTDAEIAEILADVVDAGDIAEWALKYAAYAVKNGYTNGTDASILPQIRFSPNATINAENFLAWFLNIGMGYDVAYGDAVSAAIEAKILTLSDAINLASKTALLRDDIAGILYAAAMTGVNADGTSFIQSLIDSGFVTQELAYENGFGTAPAPEKLAVSSIYASDLKQFTVVFNKEVKADTVIEANFTIDGSDADKVSLADDKKTVTVTIDDAQVASAQPASYKLVVKNVKDAAGTAMDSYSYTLKVFDNAIPVVQSVKLTAPNKFAITFSEPIATGGAVKVNNGIYGVSIDSLDGTNVVNVTLSASSLNDGNYSVEVSGFKDYAGFVADTTTLTLAYAKDTSLPVATIKSGATQTQVVVEFNKPVTLDASYGSGGADAYEDYFYHTFSAWNPDSVSKSSDNKTYTLTFNTYPIPAGTTSLVIKAKGYAEKAIVDAWGNKLDSNITLSLTVSADTTAPAVSSINVKDEQTVEIYFTEDMKQSPAENEDNFTVKDSAGKKVSTSFTNTYTADSSKGEYKVTMVFSSKLTGGDYTVEIKGQEDKALTPNALPTVTLNFTITDKTPITVGDTVVTAIAGDSGESEIIYVTYPEKMATTGEFSVLRAENYMIDVDGASSGAAPAALSSDAKLELFGTTGKVVKITIPDLTGFNVGTSQLVIARVADLAGNVSTTFSFTVVIDAEEAPVVSEVKQTDTNKVTIVINKPMSVILASGFTATGTSGGAKNIAAIDSWSINDNNETVILATLDAASATSATNTDEIIVGFNVVDNILVSETGVKMGGADYASKIKDYRAPKLIADDPSTSGFHEAVVDEPSANNSILIKFTEALDATLNRDALMAQDLVIVKVAGGTETTLVAGVDFTTAIDTNSNLKVTFTSSVHNVKFKVSSKATLTYIKDNSDQKNLATPFTTPIEVTVVNDEEP